jgi:hypothetical protein
METKYHNQDARRNKSRERNCATIFKMRESTSGESQPKKEAA